MRKTIIATMVGATLMLGACAQQSTSTATTEVSEQQLANNVLLSPSPLQYHAPEFDKITTDEYLPAFEIGLKQHSQEIQAIIDNPEAPTFDNTVVQMERIGDILKRTSNIFNNLSGLLSNDTYQAIQAEIVPQLTSHNDNIYLNDDLFTKVEAVYNQKDSLNAEDQRLVDYYYNKFIRAGAKLSDSDKAAMRDVNGQLAKLATDFGQNILKTFKDDAVIVTDKSELAGLSDEEINALAAAAKAAGKTGYMITLVNTTRQPILSRLDNRELRQKIWETSANRGLEANGPIVLKLTALRAEKAKLLGFDSWSDYVLDDQMAGNPAAVFELLGKLAPTAVAKAKTEAVQIQAEIKADGGDFELQPWDWAYYAEKVRKAKYDLDADEIKPYFEYNSVLNNGLFFTMNKLYGITMKPRNDLPVWHKDVKAWEVLNEDGSSIGLFYMDPYARVGKRGGAWMSNYVGQSFLLNNKPVIYNALNIPKPAAGEPTLLTYDEVSTLYHEFGHAIHGLFSQVKYPSLAGTATPRDFVEFPSQANEDWMINPTVIANYAKHYQTGEPISQELLTKLAASRAFNQGYDTTEYLASALLDMEWHTLKAGTEVTDVVAFEKAALAKHGVDFAPVLPRYRSTYFSHVFSGGYSSGYYAYLWAEVFAADSFQYIMDHGGLQRDIGDKYREAILSKGYSSGDLMQDYINFRGQKPEIDGLLKRRGLAD